MKKIMEQNGFQVFFYAETEHVDKRKHFIDECGWTEAEYKTISKMRWFTAHVQIRVAGLALSDQYLGCCCYNSTKEFYTTYKDDYFKDMVSEGIDEAREVLPDLISSTETQLNQLRSAA